MKDLFRGESWYIPYPYRVEMRRGYSGAVDVWVRVLKNMQWLDFPVAGGIHISMSGKLKNGIRTRLWVVQTLIEYYPEYFTGQEFEWFIIETPRWSIDDFTFPTEARALLEGPEEAVG